MGSSKTLLTFISITSFMTFCIAAVVAPGEHLRSTIEGEPYQGLIALLGFGFSIGLIFGVPLGILLTVPCRQTTMEHRFEDPMHFQNQLDEVLRKGGYHSIAPEGWVKVYAYTEGEGTTWLRLLPLSLDLVVRYREGVVQMSGPDIVIREIQKNLKESPAEPLTRST